MRVFFPFDFCPVVTYLLVASDTRAFRCTRIVGFARTVLPPPRAALRPTPATVNVTGLGEHVNARPLSRRFCRNRSKRQRSPPKRRRKSDVTQTVFCKQTRLKSCLSLRVHYRYQQMQVIRDSRCRLGQIIAYNNFVRRVYDLKL